MEKFIPRVVVANEKGTTAKKVYKVEVSEYSNIIGGYHKKVTQKYYNNLLNLLADIVEGSDNLFADVSKDYRPANFTHPYEVSYSARTDEGDAGDFVFFYKTGDKCLEVYIEDVY